MDIIKCGTPVKIDGINCTISAVEIRFERITYQLSYFFNGEYRTIWVNENEFIIGKHKTQKLGFK